MLSLFFLCLSFSCRNTRRGCSLSVTTVTTRHYWQLGVTNCCLKLWHLGTSYSIQCVPTLANVCSVRFQPGNKYILAYGSAGNLHVLTCTCSYELNLNDYLILAILHLNFIFYMIILSYLCTLAVACQKLQ